MKIILVFFCCLGVFILSSCSAEKHIMATDNASDRQIRNSIIYLIHGDASYLYHDISGTEIHADERMIKQARFVAENSPNSEVFIFHIKAARKFLFLLPLKDREIYHYRKGKLINRAQYHTDVNDPAFEYEASYYKRFSENASIAGAAGSIRRIFLFYGHQIPELGSYSYNSSHPAMLFNTDTFADGLAGFKRYNDYKFDMVVLSSCNNATPGVISKIAPISKFIIASPGNLHLSHINSLSLISLDTMQYSENSRIAAHFAGAAFDSLKALTRTEITISIFESEKVISFLKENETAYTAAINRINSEKPPSLKCIDCSTSGYLKMSGAGSGVITYYRKPGFGKPAQTDRISGWGCWKPAAD